MNDQFHELLIPGRVFQPECTLNAHWLNAGLCEYDGTLKMAFRLGRWPSAIVTATVDRENGYRLSDYRWHNSLGLGSGGNYHFVNPEDPRLIVLGDRLIMVYAAIMNERHDSEIWLYDLTKGHKWRPDFGVNGKANGKEKNWTPFIYEGKLHFIYSHHPWRIITQGHLQANWRQLYSQTIDWPWNVRYRTAYASGWNELRGGTQAVFYRGEYWHFFHTARMLASTKIYEVGAYCFAFDGEKATVRLFTPRPIMSGEPLDGTRPWWGGAIASVFPCGAVIQDGTWIISYGYLDSNVRIAEINHEVLLQHMEPLEPERCEAPKLPYREAVA